jgi:hypothetical protein
MPADKRLVLMSAPAPARFGRTRLAGLSRWPARAVLLILLLIGIGLVLDPGASGPTNGKPGKGDVALYQAIDARLLAGQDYYHAAAAEQRARGYPLKPFVTMRLPTRSWVYRAAGGKAGALILLWTIALLAVGATLRRLQREAMPRLLWMLCGFLPALTLSALVQPGLLVWHEIWAGYLIALSLACRSPRHWWPSVLLGLAAVLFRELALPYLVAMAAMALFERRRNEAIGWGIAILVVMLALALHAHAVQAVTLPGDRVSQGWSRFGGWRFDMAVLRDTSLLRMLPRPAGSVLVPLTLLGWATWRSPLAARYALTLAMWLAAFLVIGRPENFYWGLMIAPLWLAGLPLALPALRDLIRAAAQ